MFPLKRLIPLCVLLAGFSLTGCQTLTTQSSSPAPPAQQQAQATVEVRAANRKPVTREIPVQPDTRLQTIVDMSKANFRNKRVFIVRESPTTGKKHRLEATMGARGKIALETDYAIQPNDQVVIAEDTTTAIEKMMRNALGRS